MGEGDVAAGEGVEGQGVAGAEACVVEEDAAADDAALFDPRCVVSQSPNEDECTVSKVNLPSMPMFLGLSRSSWVVLL